MSRDAARDGASQRTHAERVLAVLMADEERQFGCVLKTPRGDGWRIDARPFGEIYGLAGVGFRKSEQAEWVLGLIRIEISRGLSPEEACAPYLRARAAVNLVTHRYARWLEAKQAEVEAGDRSPRTIQEYERYARAGGEISWWEKRSIFEIDFGALEDWSTWMAQRGLAAGTRRNVLGAFRTFAGWLRRRGVLRAVPEFPSVSVPEYTPTIISERTQWVILEAIPEAQRGPHLVAALMGLRSGEVRALAPSDYAPAEGDRPPLLRVSKAMQTPSWNGMPGPTKTRRSRVLPVPEPIAEWIEARWNAAARLAAKPTDSLFVNPRTRRRWSHWALRDSWLRGCKGAGVPPVPLYEGTKHSGATAMMERSGNERAVQEILGHSDVRSTRRYVELSDRAKVEVLRGGPKRRR